MKRFRKPILMLILIVVSLLTCVSCAKHEHAYGAWHMVTVADCINTGLRERECECGEKETEVVLATGHKYSSPTCTNPSKCIYCGEASGVALGHNVQNGKCTRCYKSTFEFLKEHLIADGKDEWTDGNYSIILYVSDNNKTYVTISYDPVDNVISLDCFSKSSKSTTSYLTAIKIKSTDVTSYEWSIISSENAFMKGTLYPNTFTKDSILTYTYSTYTNSSINTTYKELAKTDIDIILLVYNYAITDDNISLKNLGFKVWTN